MKSNHENDRNFIAAVLDRLLAHPDPAQALDVLEKTLKEFDCSGS